MKRVVDNLFKPLEVLIVLLLVGMVAMVFANVVLRYGFNSGISISEEMSRYFFVWLTFIGAVVTFRENAHMGVETLVRRFGRQGRVACMLATNALIVLCGAVFFWGTWKQAGINASMVAPITGMSMIWVYGIGFFTAGMIAVIAAVRILRILTGTVTPEEVASFAGEYGEASIGRRAE